MATGLILLPSAFVSAVLMPISGKIYDKFGGKYLVMAGIILTALTTWLFSHISADTSVATMSVWLVVRGIAMGMIPIMAVAMQDMPRPLVAQATTLLQMIRNLAGSFGIASTTVLLTARMAFYSKAPSAGAFIPAIQDVFLITVPLFLLAIVAAFFLKGKKTTQEGLTAPSAIT